MRVITSATSESVVRNPSMHKEVTSYLEVFLIQSHFAATAVHVWLTNTSATEVFGCLHLSLSCGIMSLYLQVQRAVRLLSLKNNDELVVPLKFVIGLFNPDTMDAFEVGKTEMCCINRRKVIAPGLCVLVCHSTEHTKRV